ncbi:hypothetical protein C0Q70_05326 [Pomacea canaliculata]|uniref:Uncharacterized protein n=1 Tax=Pomacea canaliculata TaxID=400727 RepID=A0A2T7ND11_POMCA|nr:hypothetical protein C0Q70_21613 [Pomacea canaliculata]PVD34064.1 hypothetical protein C0Q70_05326 [Pomacea canaliculata]
MFELKWDNTDSGSRALAQMSTNHVQSAGCETHHDQSSCSPVCKLRKDFSPDNRFGKPAFKTRSGQPIRLFPFLPFPPTSLLASHTIYFINYLL